MIDKLRDSTEPGLTGYRLTHEDIRARSASPPIPLSLESRKEARHELHLVEYHFELSTYLRRWLLRAPGVRRDALNSATAAGMLAPGIPLGPEPRSEVTRAKTECLLLEVLDQQSL
jgi:hypothetical protein